jgi:two-component system chemotaxis response regulator CheY
MAKTIMTVDDSASLRQMVSFTLRNAGFEVVEAVDGVDAMKKAQLTQVRLIVTDLHMPNMDGIELIRKLRALPAYKFVPIVILTTESQSEKKQDGKAAGATGWIIKPFLPDQLLAVVMKVMR